MPFSICEFVAVGVLHVKSANRNSMLVLSVHFHLCNNGIAYKNYDKRTDNCHSSTCYAILHTNHVQLCMRASVANEMSH